MATKLITTQAASTEYGITARQLIRLIQLGKLAAKKCQGVWYMRREDVERIFCP